MDKDRRMDMAVIGSITGSADVSINLATQVRDVLNAAGGSVGNDITSFFKSAAKLNMWSKYKPVVSTTLFYSFALWKSSGYRGDNGDCGLNINVYSPDNFMEAAQAGTTGWSYTPPKGGTDQPMRLGDFRGYCTDAYNPTGAVTTNGIISNGKVSFAIDVALTGSSNTNLTLSDIRIGGSNGVSLSNYYLGIYMWGNGQNLFYTSANKIGTGSDLTVSISVSNPGTYKYIPFLSSVAQTSGSAVEAKIVSCNKPSQEVTVVSSGSLKKVIPMGAWNAAGTAVTHITATLVNATSSQVTFTGIKVQLRYGSTGAGSSLIKTVSYSGSVTVAANGSTTVSMPDITSAYDQSRTYWLAGYADITTETVYNQVEENSPE